METLRYVLLFNRKDNLAAIFGPKCDTFKELEEMINKHMKESDIKNIIIVDTFTKIADVIKGSSFSFLDYFNTYYTDLKSGIINPDGRAERIGTTLLIYDGIHPAIAYKVFDCAIDNYRVSTGRRRIEDYNFYGPKMAPKRVYDIQTIEEKDVSFKVETADGRTENGHLGLADLRELRYNRLLKP